MPRGARIKPKAARIHVAADAVTQVRRARALRPRHSASRAAFRVSAGFPGQRPAPARLAPVADGALSANTHFPDWDLDVPNA